MTKKLEKAKEEGVYFCPVCGSMGACGCTFGDWYNEKSD